MAQKEESHTHVHARTHTTYIGGTQATSTEFTRRPSKDGPQSKASSSSTSKKSSKDKDANSSQASKAPKGSSSSGASEKASSKDSNSDKGNVKSWETDLGIVAFVGHGDKLGLGLQQRKGGAITVSGLADDGTAKKCNYIK
jgi:hypothetical protein